MKVGDQVAMVGWTVERIGVTQEIVRITRMDGDTQASYNAPMAWLREDGPIDLPPWQDIYAKSCAAEPLTELQQFIHDNEPSTHATAMEWRANLASVLTAISGRTVHHDSSSYIPVQEAPPSVVEVTSQPAEFAWAVADSSGLIGASIDMNQHLTFCEGALPKVMMQTTEGHTVDLHKFFTAARSMIDALDHESFDWKVYFDAMKAMMEGKSDGG